MKPYFHVDRLEFLLTRRCLSRCIHCSASTREHVNEGSYTDLTRVVAAVEQLLQHFKIRSVMTFGGEPLLYPHVLVTLQNLARKHDVPLRHVITSGYFTRHSTEAYSTIARMISSCVTDIFLSVDAFHQQHIPIQYVEAFIVALFSQGFSNVTLHPAWLVAEDFKAGYNEETKAILAKLQKFNLPVTRGNIITLLGAAKAHLSHFYPVAGSALDVRCGEIPHTNSPDRIHTLRFLPDGNVSICRAIILGNLYQESILDILSKYDPQQSRVLRLLLEGGVRRLHEFTRSSGHSIAMERYYSPCDLCADCIAALNRRQQTLIC